VEEFNAVPHHPLTTASSTADASLFTTAQFQPTSMALVLAFVANVRPLISLATPATPTLSGNGLTWERVASVTTDAGDRRLTCFRAMGDAPTRDVVRISFADDIQDVCAWSIVEYTEVATSGSSGAGAVGQSVVATETDVKMVVNLTPADAARDRTVGAIILESTDAEAVSPGAGFSEIHQQNATQFFSNGLTLQTEDSTTGVGTIAWTWANSQDAAAIVVDVKGKQPTTSTTPTSTDPATALIRRFEPILHFHPRESFVPVNAKRFVESAALWAARSPFDDKSSWGTAPSVKAGQLSTDANADHYLGKPENIVADKSHERFLELGGWKDASESHEATVTATSTNVYADRTEILRRYNSDLADSKFWYHAERFDTRRLITLANSVIAPGLKTTLANFRNPELLCYYLLYPAHEQGVDSATCSNIQAKEVACHTGDWHCIAILLEGDGPTTAADKYTPKFFGITGLRPKPVTTPTGEKFRPYAFDPEGRVTMKVESWRTGSPDSPVQPDVVGDHPRFYVAHGSHSMYIDAGEHEVSPFDEANSPAGCGHFDTPSAIPPPASDGGSTPKSNEEIFAIFFAKLIAGGLLGALGLGYISGLIESIAYGSEPFGAGSHPTTLDPPKADASPPTGAAGITVRPKNVAVPGVTSAEPVWPSDGHMVDMIVDRSRQVWWPSDDGTAGYRGRWGQRVAADPLPHRAGVKFPEFWKMFLIALEQGFGDRSLTRP
jgi:hypothetical protein